MATFVLARPVSARAVASAKRDAELAFTLLYSVEWLRRAPLGGDDSPRAMAQRRRMQDAERDSGALHDAMTRAGLSFAEDTAEVYELDPDRSSHALEQVYELLGIGQPNPFCDDGGDGVRLLTPEETLSLGEALVRLDSKIVEATMRRVLEAAWASRAGEARLNPYTGEPMTVRGKKVYGVDDATKEDDILFLTESFERLRFVVRAACDRTGFGLAVHAFPRRPSGTRIA